MATRTGVELVRVGEFNLSTGKQKFTEAMLHDAATRAAAAGPDFHAPIKLGHTDPRNDGEPAFGWLGNLRVEGTGDQAVLVGDIHDMPQWLADTSPSAYPRRSIEGNVFAAGEDGADGLEITALALLGVTPPGIGTLKSWRDLPAALAASSSELPLTAFAAAYTALQDAAPKPPAEPPAEPSTPTQKEADTMSDTIIKGLRERLGVKPDVELDEAGLLAALDESLAEKADPAPAAAELTPEAVAAAAAKAGKVLVSNDVLEELKISAAAGAQARARQLREDRDVAIDEAFKAGKIAAARKEHWAKAWDADPEGVKASLDELPSIYPVAASGHGGGETPGATDAPFSDDEAAAMASMTGTSKEAWL